MKGWHIMKKGLTELVFILDKSGSMSGLESDTIGGFNGMIEKQKLDEGEALVTTVLFSSQSTILHDRLPLEKIPPMTRSDYCVSGCTALLDAIGDTVEHIGTIQRYARKEDVPEHTVFIITTDGMENASHRYSSEKIKELISAKKSLGWDFIFLGANIDSVETAAHFGIEKDSAVNYICDPLGTKTVFKSVARAVSAVRRNEPLLDSDWRAELDADYEERAGK